MTFDEKQDLLYVELDEWLRYPSVDEWIPAWFFFVAMDAAVDYEDLVLYRWQEEQGEFRELFGGKVPPGRMSMASIQQEMLSQINHANEEQLDTYLRARDVWMEAP